MAVTLLLAAAVAGAVPADSVGPAPPLNTIPESRCAPMHLSPHVVEVGQKVTATAASNGPLTCGGDVTGTRLTWSWDQFPGLTAKSGCADDSATCTFKATEATGEPGSRYTIGCIDGNSAMGSWNSCDYYAVLPKCHGHPSLTLTHQRVRGATIIDFRGRDWDTPDCGPVSLNATVEDGTQPVATINTSNFRAQLRIRGRRICGLELTAHQAPHRTRKASYTRGPAVKVAIVLAKPGVTPDGEPLGAGDVLCRDDLPANVYDDLRANNLQPGDVNAIAGALGQQIIEVASTHGARQDYYLADAAGQVSVVGLSVPGASPSLLGSFGDNIVDRQGVDDVGSEGSNVTLSGWNHAGGSYTVQGNLQLDNGYLYVEGDLNVTGTITGRGAIIATGSVNAAGADLVTDSTYGLVAGGQLGLP